MRSIYGDFDLLFGKGNSSTVDPNLLMSLGRPFFAQLNKLTGQHDLAQTMLKSYKGKSAEMEQGMEKGQSVIRNVLQAGNNKILGRFFRGWKLVCHYRIVSKEYVLGQFRRAKLRIWFHGE